MFTVAKHVVNINNKEAQISITTTLHPLNGLFTSRTWVSQYKNGKNSLDLNCARDDWVLGWQ